jgi:hypothetical protein
MPSNLLAYALEFFSPPFVAFLYKHKQQIAVLASVLVLVAAFFYLRSTKVSQVKDYKIATYEDMHQLLLQELSAKTFAQATANFKDTHTLLTSIASGATDPTKLTGRDAELVKTYAYDEGSKTWDYAKGMTNLQNAVRVTASSAREAATNPTLRGEFKTPQATAARAMLEDLNTGPFAGVATADVATVTGMIDKITGLK